MRTAASGFQRVDAGAKCSAVRHTERRVNDDNPGPHLDEVRIHWKKSGLETMNGDVRFGSHRSERTIERRWQKMTNFPVILPRPSSDQRTLAGPLSARRAHVVAKAPPGIARSQPDTRARKIADFQLAIEAITPDLLDIERCAQLGDQRDREVVQGAKALRIGDPRVSLRWWPFRTPSIHCSSSRVLSTPCHAIPSVSRSANQRLRPSLLPQPDDVDGD
jgi:hypothetical protein